MQLSLSAESPREQTEFKYNKQAQQQCKYTNKHISNDLKRIGFTQPTKLTDTLQGSVYRAINPQTNKACVIKLTNQNLHNESLALSDGKMYKCSENILLESSILRFLSQQIDCPDSIAKFISFSKSDSDYILVMEDGGSSLFDFISKTHQLIQSGKISIPHWQKVSKKIFSQMIESIDFIHCKNVCHFDISLENFLINDVKVLVNKSAKSGAEMLEFVVDDIQVKLCDFGLAQLFTNSDTKSSRFVGKSNYKSPEIHSKKKGFDGKMNDIWCSGVALFCLISGIAPFSVANETDEAFQCIMESNQLLELLQAWAVLDYFDHCSFALVESMFQYENERISVQEIKRHSWLK